MRHELGHILAGDARELTTFSFQYPLPEAEMVADLFAFADLIPAAVVSQGASAVGRCIRSVVALEAPTWYLRIERVAILLPHLAEMLGWDAATSHTASLR